MADPESLLAEFGRPDPVLLAPVADVMARGDRRRRRHRTLVTGGAVVALLAAGGLTYGLSSSGGRDQSLRPAQTAPPSRSAPPTAPPPSPSSPARGPSSSPPVSSPPAPSAAASSGWMTYRNETYGFRAQVPRSLTAGPSPTGGEGLTYRSADGHTEETASASATAPGATVASEAADHAADLSRRGELTYTHLDVTGNAFTVSGYLYGGTVVEYLRGVIGPHTEYLLSWTYPTSERTTADPWVQHTVETVQAGPL